MKCKRVFVAMIAVSLTVGAGWARQAPPQPPQQTPKSEPSNNPRLSPEEQQQRLDHWKTRPERSWSEFIADWLTPKPFSKKYAVRIDDKYAYPHVAASIRMEIVREDDEFVWLRGIPPEDPKSPLYSVWAQQQVDEIRLLRAAEAMETEGAIYFLDFDAEPVPPAFQKSLDIEPHGDNLPEGGRWQMGFAVGDMNGDGVQDLIFPPRRQSYPPVFAIMLGTGGGGFEGWRDVKWPTSLRLDYGGVDVADLDGDGHQDIVAAIHFGPQYVFYGDGKGDFTRTERLPSPDPRITSRAVTAGDYDGDGHTDLAFVAEIDYDVKTNHAIDGSATVWVVYRRGQSWKVVSEGFATDQIADVIRSVDVDGDGKVDLVVSANSVGERRLVYLNGGGEKWSPAPFNGVLSAAYHYDVESFGGETFSTFVQFKMVDQKTQALNGIVAYPFAFREKGWRDGQPIVVERERTSVFFRLALGDLNGDGHTDMVVSRKTGGLEVYLRGQNGGFLKENTTNLAETGVAYDVRLMDLNGDGFDDIIAGFVPGPSGTGGVRVWLTHPMGSGN